MWLGLGQVLIFAGYLQTLHLLPWFSWQSEALAILALVFFAVDVLRRDSTAVRANMRIPRLVLGFAIVIPVITVQWMSGLISFGGDALVRSIYAFLCIVAIAVGFRWSRSRQTTRSLFAGANSLRGLAFCLLASALASVFVAILQSTQVHTIFDAWVLPPVGIRRPGANMGQPNHLATLLLLGIASLVFLHMIKSLGSVVSAILLAFLLLGLAISESRTGLVSAVVMTAWWWIKRQKVEFSWSGGSVALSWIALLLAVWAWPAAIAIFHEGNSNAEAAIQGINTSAGTRLTIWPQLWAAVFERPWHGWGVGEVSKAHNAVLDRYPTSEPFTYAHNIFLDMALGWGVVITVLVTLALGWWFVSRLRAARTLQAWYCACLVLPLAVHSCFEFPFAYAYFLMPCLIAAGYLEGQYRPQSVFQLPRAFAIFSLAAFTLLLISVALEYIKVEEDFRIARFEALRIGQPPEDYERPRLILLTQMNAMLEATRVTPSASMSAEQIVALRNTALRFPWPAMQNRYALSLALNGEPAEALRQLKVMRAMHGEGGYATIRNQWREYGETRYPQLKGIVLP